MANQLKSDAIMDLMKQHLSTDSGNDLTKKIGLVYQINIAPKVLFFFFFFLFYLLPYLCRFNFQKLGFDEVTYIVDLKKGDVIKGQTLIYISLILAMGEIFMAFSAPNRL